jgi:putative nucleotidyltransferase with HDIG domain
MPFGTVVAKDEESKPTLERLERHLAELPVLPMVVLELMQLKPSDDAYFEKVSSLIARDPAFATRTLRLANSAMYSTPRTIGTLREAVLRIGSSEAAAFIMAHSAVRVFLPRGDWQSNLWRHALQVGGFARGLAPFVRGASVPQEVAYLGGLLHDLGRFILYLEAPEELRDIDEAQWSTPDELIAAEQRICGFNHAELGYLAARKWNLPADLASLIRYHHGGGRAAGLSSDLMAIVSLVVTADRVAVLLATHRDASDEQVEAMLASSPTTFTMTPKEQVALIRASDRETGIVATMLGLG